MTRQTKCRLTENPLTVAMRLVVFKLNGDLFIWWGLVERVEVERDGEKKIWQKNQTLLSRTSLHFRP